jgi:hypothetical protein
LATSASLAGAPRCPESIVAGRGMAGKGRPAIAASGEKIGQRVTVAVPVRKGWWEARCTLGVGAKSGGSLPCGALDGRTVWALDPDAGNGVRTASVRPWRHALRCRSRAGADHPDGGKPAWSRAPPRRVLPPGSSPENRAGRPEIGLPERLAPPASPIRRDLGSSSVRERIDRSIPQRLPRSGVGPRWQRSHQVRERGLFPPAPDATAP